MLLNSLQLLDLAPQARVWADLGSGGGFPGMPIACALAGQTGAQVHLIESNGKKAAFLRAAVRATGVPAIVHQERIDEIWGNLCRNHASRYGARPGAIENLMRSGVSFCFQRRHRSVPKRSRCRG